MKSSSTLLWLISLLGIASGAGCSSPPAGGTPVAAAAPADVATRIKSHGNPSIFQAWSPIQNLNQAPGPAVPLSTIESRLQSLARHDLIFMTDAAYGLVLNNPVNPGLSTGFTPESVQRALAFRGQLLALNPHAVLLVEIRYHDSRPGYFPDDSPWWRRDGSGRRVRKTEGTSVNGYLMVDLSQPGLQDQVATLCAAAIDTGAVDGCMLDWWSRDDADHAAIARKIRDKIGDRGVILVNTNGKLPTPSAPYLNGMFMEGFGASFFSDWRTAVKNVQWAATHLHPPTFTALELWYPNGTPVSGTTGRNDLAKMRLVTALSLCNGDGYVLYSDPFPTPGHPHDWYAFWKPTLGAPVEAAGRINPDGSYGRNFQNGTVIFNPPDNHAVTVEFKTPVTRQSTQEIGTRFTVPDSDGEIFIYR